MSLHQVILGCTEKGSIKVIIDKNDVPKMHRAYPIDLYLSRVAFDFIVKYLGNTYALTTYDVDTEATLHSVKEDLECALRFYNTVQNWSTRRKHSLARRIPK